MLQSLRSILFSWQILLRLLVAFAIPSFFFSGIMTAAADNINSFLGGTKTKARIGLVGKSYVPNDLLQKFETTATLTHLQQEEELLELLDKDSLDIGVLFPNNFANDTNRQKKIKVYYNAVQHGEEAHTALDILENYEQKLVLNKVEAMGLAPEIVNPIVIQKTNTFNAFITIGKIMDNIRGIVSNVLNFLFILLVIWLTRILVLRAYYRAPKNFLTNLILIFLVTLLGMGLAFVGFQAGLDAEQVGMVRSIILSIEQLLVWNKLSSMLLLWCPTWLFIIGIFGCIAAFSNSMVAAYTRTFWATIVIHAIALYGLVPIQEMNAIDPFLPILNVFRVGQLAMKGTLDTGSWTIAMVVSSIAAVVLLLLWRMLYQKSDENDL